MEDPCSKFVSLHPFHRKNLIARLYIEVVDGIGRKETNLILESLVVQKPFEKLWDEEATLKIWFLVCYSIWY